MSCPNVTLMLRPESDPRFASVTCCCQLSAVERVELLLSSEVGWKGGTMMVTMRRSCCAVPLDSSLRRSSLVEVLTSRLIMLALT
eukprot:scaffold4762_cov73-Phaeocystis_antarctica.AAC.1